MNQPRRFRIVESASASARLADAAAYLDRFPPHRPINIVAAARGAADDLARRVAVARGSTVGLARYSVTQCAARVAATRLAGVGLAPATALGSEAVAARAAFEAREAGVLEYFGGVVRTPGFARALSQTLGALRAAGLMPESLAAAGESGHDLASLMTRAGLAYENAATADRVRLFEVAAAAAVDDPTLAAPLLLLDVAIESPSEETFIAALVSAATEACATIPVHDEHSCEALQRAGGVRERLEATGDTDLDSLRTYLFSDESPPERGPDDGSVDFFSAPGEGRECVEIARRILGEARRGVRFDEMAVLVRSPDHYQGLLEHALARAQVPAWFDRGTRRPHPAGRAFLALLRCAAEGLSARRFAEYLSLGQVPAVDSGAPEWQAAEDELLVVQAREDVPSIEAEVPSDSPDEDDDRVRSGGTLVTPRGWERLLARLRSSEATLHVGSGAWAVWQVSSPRDVSRPNATTRVRRGLPGWSGTRHGWRCCVHSLSR